MHIMGHDATVSLQAHWLKCIVIIILNTIIHTSATQATQNAMDEILTLVRSIQIALEQNPQLRASNAQVRAARNQLRRARAQFYPRVDFTASFRQQGPEVSFTVPFGPRAYTVTVIPHFFRDLGVQLTQPILSGGRLEAAYRIAKHAVAATQQRHTATILQLVRRIRHAYLDVLEAEGLLEVATAAMRRVQELNRVVRVRFEAGAVPRFDILRVQAELAQAREQLISAQNALALARAAFNMLLGRDITTPVHLSKLDSPPPAPASLTAVGAERQLLDLAYAQRPDIQAARKGVELARERLKLARAERNPMVNLVADFHRQTATGLRAAESKSAMLVVQMPIFDSGRVNAQIEEAKANLDSARQQLTALEQQVALEVKQAILNWRSAKERYESARAVLKQAEEAYRIAQLRYESGVGTNVEVLDTQVALTRARTNYVRALHDLHRAYADLDYAVGKPVEQVLAELALRTAQLKPKQ